MRTIETTVRIQADRTLTIQLPPDVPAGECRVVLVIDVPILEAVAAIDAGFAGMAEDAEYQQEAIQIEGEFAPSQWEALQLAEI